MSQRWKLDNLLHLKTKIWNLELENMEPFLFSLFSVDVIIYCVI